LYDIATHFGVVSDSADVVAALRDGTSLQPAEVAA
ncbi:cysteine hydrolase, partial [Mesorhizobium sp. M7A.F.Ca.CA.001.13.2.1]